MSNTVVITSKQKTSTVRMTNYLPETGEVGYFHTYRLSGNAIAFNE